MDPIYRSKESVIAKREEKPISPKDRVKQTEQFHRVEWLHSQSITVSSAKKLIFEVPCKLDPLHECNQSVEHNHWWGKTLFGFGS